MVGFIRFPQDRLRRPLPAQRLGLSLFLKLYALDTALDLPAGATKKELLKAMEGHVLAEGQLMGRYQR